MPEQAISASRRSRTPLLRHAGGSQNLTAAWFDSTEDAVFLVHPDGALVAANAVGERVLSARKILTTCSEILVPVDPRARAVFAKWLSGVSVRRPERVRLPVRDEDGCWRAFELYPGRKEAFGLAFVRVRPRTADRGKMDPLRLVFSLSPAETDVLSRLLDGLSPKQIARSLEVSPNTVRAHLRAIYAKMNTRGMTGAIQLATKLTD